MLFWLSPRSEFKIFYFILWCFTGVKHLGTCDLSGLWLLAEPSEKILRILAGTARILRIFSLQNPNPLGGFGENS
jgi:hypothetical protein